MSVCVCVCVYVVERFGDGREQMPSFSAESHLVLSDSLRIDRTPPPHRPMHAISYTIFLFLFFLVSSLSSYSGPSLLYLQFQPPSPPLKIPRPPFFLRLLLFMPSARQVHHRPRWDVVLKQINRADSGFDSSRSD